jgi:hypothetical protein
VVDLQDRIPVEELTREVWSFGPSQNDDVYPPDQPAPPPCLRPTAELTMP